jgi:hypothetical protein
MAQEVLRVTGLPAAPLDAAAAFHTDWLPPARAASGDLVLIMPEAGLEHRAWRLAAVQELAREATPRRVNAVAGGDAAAIVAAVAYLADAPGITGQLLAVGGKPAKRG